MELNQENVDLFYQLITERQNIWYKRFVLKQNPPWTQDKILQQYKFTNVYRILDPGTQMLFTDIFNQKTSDVDKLFNCFIYRIFNKIDTYRLNGFVKLEDFQIEDFLQRIKDFRAEGNTIFTSAFMVTGSIHLDTHDKVEKYCRVIQDIQRKLPLVYDVIKEKNLSMEDCHRTWSNNFDGIGKFLSYQIMLDAMYDRILPYSENDWSFAFLGCARGLKYIFPNLDMNDDVKCLEAMRWLHEHQKEYLEPLNFKSLGAYELANGYVYDGTTISLSNIENCLCEFSKYMKTKLGEGRPRVLYKPKSFENHTLLSF